MVQTKIIQSSIRTTEVTSLNLWVRPKGENSMLMFGLGCRKACVGTGWATALHLCKNGLRKQCSGLEWPPFLPIKYGLSLAKSHDN